MNVLIHPWENQLLEKASLALDESLTHRFQPSADETRLRKAYVLCEQITRDHSRTFYTATAIMPRASRRAIRALYAFCRTSDDVVDVSSGDREAQFAAWREAVLHTSSDPENTVLLAWTDTRLKYQVPDKYIEQLLDGVARDFTKERYDTFGELAEYCYGVASTVGLMSMHIIGFSGHDAIPYAVKLGVALQMTNILRDVGEDWRAGRLYLPQEELAHFGLSETDIDAGIVDDRWRSFMRFQIGRTRRLYRESMPGINMLSTSGKFSVAAAAELYSAILDDIEVHDYNVFNRRAHITDSRKVAMLPGIIWRAGTNGYQI
jgi:15-cis-phytoene synthase